MKMLSWNSRGSSWPGFIAQASFYAHNLDIDVFCILDTRASSDIINKTRNLPFDGSYVIPAQGQCGGLLLLWKTRMVHIDVIMPHNRFIHCMITDTATNISWYTTFIYAYPKKEQQAALWNEILDLRPSNDEPWLVVGDFNIIASLDEKLGGNQVITNFMLNFVTFLNNANLTSLNASGVPFTWTNKHKDDTLIYERLDRACVNANFLNKFPNANLENLSIIGSDHGPICLTMRQKQTRKGNGFKFEAIWLAHEGFRPLVNGLWKQNLENDPFLNFLAICNQFKSQVKVWNKNVYGNLFKKIEDLNGRSNDIQQQLMLSPFSSYLQEQDLIVRKQLLQCYKDEEIFWAQKARANWLNLGDRNTKFFQTQTNMRKRSNTIVKLKNEVGGWATSREEISDILIKDFKRRFQKECLKKKFGML
uniref:uncharacterized protein LOC105349933 isoform X1 n=1 Tax=Fragaria vesca subsp. vesca TaxID=101020 RepID=UPI0005CA3A9D|nr:PREDICTED: uncharacterized protein LOC105349933 isoform X1 [Fragaria vesca subsp. vesca]